ncbi:hypothetical protein SCP_1004870 [Sparassis crispa]|uniref:Uncharacterized protein n=1 Tax=Sparassis crispa TaxID=139825 RepID=A0A401GYK6_9APHY|nr:hypothetical protein SCP_1004870 [Sparassis crispa]GBE87240.1 hypothetical protein SCP_1004870 [Sparassis crispa]
MSKPVVSHTIKEACSPADRPELSPPSWAPSSVPIGNMDISFLGEYPWGTGKRTFLRHLTHNFKSRKNIQLMKN